MKMKVVKQISRFMSMIEAVGGNRFKRFSDEIYRSQRTGWAVQSEELASVI